LDVFERSAVAAKLVLPRGQTIHLQQKSDDVYVLLLTQSSRTIRWHRISHIIEEISEGFAIHVRDEVSTD
jgi:hypothetical protein